MKKKIGAGRVVMACAALGLAFWAGRTTSSADKGRPEDARATRSSGRDGSAQRAVPAAAKATSALQLHDCFKGCSYTVGVLRAQAALAHMNSTEVATLVRDLVNTSAPLGNGALNNEVIEAMERWAEVDPDAALAFVAQTGSDSFRKTAITALFRILTQNDPELARAKIATLGDAALQRAARTEMLEILSTTRPDEWIEVVRADPALIKSEFDMASLASGWALEDMAQALKRLERLPVKLQKEATVAIARVWAAKDRAAVLAWAGSVPSAERRSEVLAAVAGSLASQDPAEALKALADQPTGLRRAGVTSIFETLATQDFDASIERAMSLENRTDRQAALAAIVGTQEITPDAGRLADVLSQLQPGETRNKALRLLGTGLCDSSPEEADAILQNYSDDERKLVMGKMVEDLLHDDPRRAMDIIQKQGRDVCDYEDFILTLWHSATVDPEATLKAATFFEESGGSRSQVYDAVFRQFAKTDPAIALQHLADLPAEYRVNAIQALAGAWGEVEPTAAIAWADQLSGRERNYAVSNVVIAVSREDAPGAAQLLLGQLGVVGEQLGDAAKSITETWGSQDPAATAAWLANLPEGESKQHSLNYLVSLWCERDAEAAAKWIVTLPAGPVRDRGAVSLAHEFYYTDPAAALQWASSIGDDEQRAAITASAVDSWNEKDPDAARAALAKSSLPADERAALLKRLNGAR